MRALRGPYEGVLQIVRFNWPMYLAAGILLLLGTAIVFLAPLPSFARIPMFAGLGLAGFWLALSLLVSHYVYDRSPLYRGDWLTSTFPDSPSRYANLHVGLDEFSGILRSKFQRAEATTIDFFDPVEMTEPSIRRARREHLADLPASLPADFRALPFPENEFDAAFLIFAAHELREPASRTRLLQEIRRVLQPDGKLLLVEHLRDFANFLAFGPGFVHFHSRAEWLHVIRDANLAATQEFRCTPFVRVFLLEPKT